MHIKIQTNIQKSQFRDLGDGTLQILGIPITVDDAVMNGIHYNAEDNAKGLTSYRGQPLTLRHPADENGQGISGTSGKGLMNHFSGGVVTNTYNANGINYADAEFKEKLMLAQDNGEYYANRIKEGLPIGISTGLFFDGNNDSGTNAKGEEYHAVARNQVGDHIAMLPEDEPPAGGAATFIVFNEKNDDQSLTVNIDEIILALNSEANELIDTIATNDAEKSLLGKFWAVCKQKFAKEKAPCDNADSKDKILTNQEGDAMRETVENELTAKGIAFNKSDTDAVLLALLNKPAEVKDPTEAINAAVEKALAPLNNKLEAAVATITANADKELDALAENAAKHLKGFDKETLKAMGANKIHKALADNGVTVGVASGTNHQSPEQKPDGEKLTKFWEAK